jgi:hypothetical protein
MRRLGFESLPAPTDLGSWVADLAVLVGPCVDLGDWETSDTASFDVGVPEALLGRARSDSVDHLMVIREDRPGRPERVPPEVLLNGRRPGPAHRSGIGPLGTGTSMPPRMDKNAG